MVPQHSRSQSDLVQAHRWLWEQPRASNLIEMISTPAAVCPELPAIYFSREGAGSEAVTWSSLWRGACAEAARLRDAKLQSGDRVMLIMPNTAAFLETFFGTLVAGGIPVPVAPPQSLKGSKLEAYLDLLRGIILDSGASFCIGLPRTMHILRASLLEVQPEMRILEGDSKSNAGAAIEPFLPDARDTALIQYTSGSTSQPKGVELSHANILANIRAIAEEIVAPDTVCVSWLPLYHDMGLIGTSLTPLYCRVPVTLMTPQAFIKDPSAWLRCIHDCRATVTVAPNFAFNYCVKNIKLEQMSGVRLDSLKIALNGAEPVDPVAVESFCEKFKPLGLRDGVVLPVYGLAESSLAVTFSDRGRYITDLVDADRLERYRQAVPARRRSRSRTFISVGRPLPTQEVRVVDEMDRPLPERCVGEIVVKGPSVMKGYYNRPAETAETLRGGWLHTADLGYMADGHLFISGRLKDLIIRNGKNYYPQDIEHVVTRIESVRKGCAVAFGVEARPVERLVVVAETRLRDAKALATLDREIRQRCHDAFTFPPDDVRLVAPGKIPRTTSGKVRRQECKRIYLLDPGSETKAGKGYGVIVRLLVRSLLTKLRRQLSALAIRLRTRSSSGE
jgi:fatty-acyl-CoA synthase